MTVPLIGAPVHLVHSPDVAQWADSDPLHVPVHVGPGPTHRATRVDLT
jgi:hypothetical protein